jgi:hypothetical protein
VIKASVSVGGEVEEVEKIEIAGQSKRNGITI